MESRRAVPVLSPPTSSAAMLRSCVKIQPCLLQTDLLVAFMLLIVLLSTRGINCAAPDPSWPTGDAPLVLRIIKKSGFELDNEPQWMHLHRDPANPAAQQLKLTIQVHSMLSTSGVLLSGILLPRLIYGW